MRSSWVLHTVLISLFCYFYVLVDAAWGALPQAHQEGVLRPFKSYADVTLFHYYVPPECGTATFEFAAFHDNPGCPVREAFIYVQHGSYPVMSPNNATFPSSFWVNRTSLQRTVVRSSYNTHDAKGLPIDNPLPGNWFVAAYLNTWNQKVQQEGLGHKCRYSLGSVGLWSTIPGVNTVPLMSTVRVISTQHFTYYKFYVPSGIVMFTLKVDGCRFLTKYRPGGNANSNNNNSGNDEGPIPCIHNILLRDRALPFYHDTDKAVLTNDPKSQFTLVEKLPRTDVYYYLLVVAESKIEYNLTILPEECPVVPPTKPSSKISIFEKFVGDFRSQTWKDETLNVTMISNDLNEVSLDTEDGGEEATIPFNFTEFYQNLCPCIPTFRLARIRHAQDFSDTFLLEGKSWLTTWLALAESNPYVPIVGASFELLPFIDIGGTLSINVHLDQLLMNVTSQTVHVYVCVKQGRRPKTFCCDFSKETADSCCDAISLHVSSKNVSEGNAQVYIPFPEADVYYMSFKMNCEFNGTTVPCAVGHAPIALDVRTQPCVYQNRYQEGSPPVYACGSFGYCEEVHKNQYFYTSCRCVAGYKGWACNDDSEAIPKDVLLTTTLLLTVSNIFFVPAIILALSRRMFVQALVYFCTMISSTLYHACDQEVYSYCFSRYSVLQFCDFFCSILAFWVTIISIARTPTEYDSVLYVFGAVLIAIGVEYNRTGLLVFVVPFALGFSYVVGIWACRSFRRRTLILPKIARILLFIPGVLLGASGLVLFAFVETEENYRYTHSAWHTIIAISLLYLLPKRRTPKMQQLLSNGAISEMTHVTNGDYNNHHHPPSTASPVFFITSELDHLVQDPTRPQ